MAHDCSFLLWINERIASLDSCLLRHKMLAILEGRDCAPEWIGQPQYDATCAGALKSLVREGANGSPYARWARRRVTQLLRFACRFLRTDLPRTRVVGPREQSPWSSKKTEGAWHDPSPQDQAVSITICLLHCATQYYFLCAMMLGGKLK